MAKGPDDTTDKLFPPPENPNPDAPIPLGPSIRVQFKEHRQAVSETLAAFALRIEALESKADAGGSKSVLGAVKHGAVVAGKATPIVVLVLEAAAQVASALGRTQWVGPLRALLSLFGA